MTCRPGLAFLPLLALLSAFVAPSPAAIEPRNPPGSDGTGETISDADATLALARDLAAVPAHRTEALALYAQLLTESPGSVALLREHRNTASKLARPDLVASDFATLEKSGPLSAEETLWYAGALQKLGRNDETMALIEQQLGGAGDQTALLALYLEAASAAHERSRAEKKLALLAARHPRRADLAIASATLARERSDPATAESALRAALAADPDNPGLLKLLAEILFARDQPRKALVIYCRAVSAAPNDVPLRRQTARVAEICHDTRAVDALLQPVIHSPAIPAKERAATALEARGMAALRAGRYPEALHAYTKLCAAEPGNVSADYGRAAALRGAGALNAARTAYRDLLQADPNAAYARNAANQITNELRNRLRAAYLFINEDSPGRMADISRNIFTVSDEFWLTDRLKMSLGGRTWIEQPEGIGSPYVATGATATVDYRIAASWRVNLNYTFKNYTTRSLRDTHNGGAALAFNPSKALGLYASYQHEDALTNRYNFTQSTQSDTGRLSFESQPLHCLEVSGSAFLRGYSDQNLQFGADGGAGLVLLRDPGKLVTELRGQYLTTQHQSESEFTDGEETNVIHPYWTPRNYFRGSLGVNWEQSLRPAASADQNELGYRAGVRGSLDTDGNPAIAFDAALRCEIARHLLVDLGGQIERSPQWNGATASVSVAYAF
ncbi:MAG: tetratricopeptide repeat protein [Terrimicrobiaceae bacterium]|nr:tetratricopeptide repeat protein [Terrimicrobiaceae bacterium]